MLSFALSHHVFAVTSYGLRGLQMDFEFQLGGYIL